MSARNKKSVLRTMRIPHDLDSEINALCAGRRRCYSVCLLGLVRAGLNAGTPEKPGEKVADHFLQWMSGKK